MSVPKDRFLEGFTWGDWIEILGDQGPEWAARCDEAALGPLRADYQAVPTPRFVLCLLDQNEAGSREFVPLIARACDQAGETGGVDLRLFPLERSRDLADQYLTGETVRLPVCVVFDEDWVQVGIWHPRPPDGPAEDEQGVLSAFLDALRGQPGRPWATRNLAEHRRKQTEQAGEQRL